MAQDEISALVGGYERQPDDAIAQLRIGLYDGVLGAFSLFSALAALLIGRVNLRPPRCKKDRIGVAALQSLLAQVIGERVSVEISAGERVADAAIEVDRSRGPNGREAVPGRDRSLHQKLGKQRRVGPGQGGTAYGDLFLDNGACVFRHADLATAGEFGQHGGLAATRASSDDVEGWDLDIQIDMITGSPFNFACRSSKIYLADSPAVDEALH